MFDPGVALLWLENYPEWIIGVIFLNLIIRKSLLKK